MAYIRELIGNKSKKKIMNDLEAGGRFFNLYKLQDAYHEKELSSLKWAVDKEKNYYLLAAPQVARSREKPFLFYYENRMYQFFRFVTVVDGLLSSEGFFEEDFEDEQFFLSLKTEMEKAYKCHCINSNYDIEKVSSELTVNKKEKM